MSKTGLFYIQQFGSMSKRDDYNAYGLAATYNFKFEHEFDGR